MTKPASRTEACLEELCVKYGYCLPPDEAAVLGANPPADADSFVDAVLVAEGLDPLLVEKRARNELREVVCDWLLFAASSWTVGSGVIPERWRMPCRQRTT